MLLSDTTKKILIPLVPTIVALIGYAFLFIMETNSFKIYISKLETEVIQLKKSLDREERIIQELSTKLYTLREKVNGVKIQQESYIDTLIIVRSQLGSEIMEIRNYIFLDKKLPMRTKSD